MSTVLFVVKATITADQEDAFNHWYNTEHCPQLLRYRGAVRKATVSAANAVFRRHRRRYRLA